VVVGVASTGTARSVGALLRPAVCRVAVVGGLALLAWLLGSAVANAATASDTVQPTVTQSAANTAASQEPGLFTRLLDGLLGHSTLGGDTTSEGQGTTGKNPPTDTSSDNGSSSGGTAVILPSPIITHGGNGSSSGDGVWTGSTTVTVPVTPEPAVAPSSPPAPSASEPVVQPVRGSHPVVQQQATSQATKPVVASMTSPKENSDYPQRPTEEPLQQQPASQPVSSPASGSGLTGHDAGGNSGVAGVVPPQTGFQPTPGSSTDEHNAKRVTEGVPGLPSTSPD
jgi:hypothetical protein